MKSTFQNGVGGCFATDHHVRERAQYEVWYLAAPVVVAVAAVQCRNERPKDSDEELREHAKENAEDVVQVA